MVLFWSRYYIVKRCIVINIGIDIGGRHVGMALIDEKGKVHNKEIINYQKDNSSEFIISEINKYIQKNENKAKAIGIGVPGIIRNNKIVYTCNLSLEDSNFVRRIKTKLPIYLANDAICATYAEYKVIDDSKYDNYALVTIGTGIGAGLIIDKRIYEGKNGYAGEIGHTVIKKGGIECNCGRKGCFEKYASVSRLLEITKCKSLGEVFEKLENSSELSKVFDEYLDDLAEGLANFIMINDVDMVVIGGSLAWFGDKFYYILRAKIASRLFNRETNDVKIKFAKLGNNAGLIGASLLASI